MVVSKCVRLPAHNCPLLDRLPTAHSWPTHDPLMIHSWFNLLLDVQSGTWCMQMASSSAAGPAPWHTMHNLLLPARYAEEYTAYKAFNHNNQACNKCIYLLKQAPQGLSLEERQHALAKHITSVEEAITGTEARLELLKKSKQSKAAVKKQHNSLCVTKDKQHAALAHWRAQEEVMQGRDPGLMLPQCTGHGMSDQVGIDKMLDQLEEKWGEMAEQHADKSVYFVLEVCSQAPSRASKRALDTPFTVSSKVQKAMDGEVEKESVAARTKRPQGQACSQSVAKGAEKKGGHKKKGGEKEGGKAKAKQMRFDIGIMVVGGEQVEGEQQAKLDVVIEVESTSERDAQTGDVMPSGEILIKWNVLKEDELEERAQLALSTALGKF